MLSFVEGRIERNFKKVKCLPYWLTRGWRKKTGPLELNLITAASARNTGERAISAAPLPTISMARLMSREVFFFSPSSKRSGYRGAESDLPVPSPAQQSGKA